MAKTIFLLLISILSFSACANRKENMVLSLNGVAQYEIILPNSASKSEKLAAKQLKIYLDQITGGNFKIINESSVVSSGQMKRIFIGATDYCKKNIGRDRIDLLKEDGIIIKTIKSNLVLTGEGSRGVLYAVYDFLETYADCKWLTPESKIIPRNKNLVVVGIDKFFNPPFSYRAHFIFNTLQDSEFAVSLHENGDKLPLSEWGGQVQILGFVHTFSLILPPEKYFREHPEWYSDPNNSHKPCTKKSVMPAPQETQLNLSDPNMQKAFLANTMKWISDNPGYSIISISQNDNKNYCHSTGDEAIVKAEGSASGLILRFVNKIAKEVAKKYPQKKVETLAYYFSEMPPKITKPGPNVIMRFAPIESNVGYSINSKQNESVRLNIINWNKISKNNFYWGYSSNFAHPLLPHPNLYHLRSDLQFLKENSFKGIFIQDNTNPGGYGYFTNMLAWVTGHLMWNPDLNYEVLIDQFMTAYYGEAGIYMKQYYTLIEKAYLAQGNTLVSFNDDLSFMTPKVLKEGDNIFAQALEKVKANPELTKRIKIEKISFDFTKLYTYSKSSTELANYPIKEKEFFDSLAALNYDNVFIQNSLSQYREVLRNDLNTVHRNNINATNIGNLYTFQEDKFNLYEQSKLSDLVKDEKASNAQAAIIHGITNTWAVTLVLNNYKKDLITSDYDIIAYLKVDLKGSLEQSNQRGYINFGLFDSAKKTYPATKEIAARDLAGDYKRVVIKNVKLNPDQVVWFSINAPGNDVNRLLIDKIELKKLN